MKKAITVTIILILLVSFFAGCQAFRDPNTLSMESLSEEQKTTIRNKYLIKYNADFSWDLTGGETSYFGTINNCVILMPLGTTLQPGIVMHYTFEIADHTFECYESRDLFAYREGKICTLAEAYQQGWLTKDHIGVICEKYNREYQEYLQRLEENNA